jgi:hypothetical protein
MYDCIWFRSQYGFVTTGLGTPTGNQLLSGEVSSNSELARRNVGYYDVILVGSLLVKKRN